VKIKDPLVQLHVMFRSGEMVTIEGTLSEAEVFHKRFHRYLHENKTESDHYKSLQFSHRIIVSSEVAHYAAFYPDGSVVQFVEKRR
jgi:hypothetical protein